MPAEYATDKRAIAHRALSLLLAIGLLLLEALDGSGFVPLRIVNGVYIIPLMLIWFPDACSGWADVRNGAKYARFFGWVLLLVVPLWFAGLRWLAH